MAKQLILCYLLEFRWGDGEVKVMRSNGLVTLKCLGISTVGKSADDAEARVITKPSGNGNDLIMLPRKTSKL